MTTEQVQVLESVRDNKITNVQAGHGVGKTFIAAVIVLWWIFCVGGRAITTAPTERQVKDLLWYEIRVMYDDYESVLGGSRGEMILKLSTKAYATGFVARDYKTDGFQGVHHPKLLAIQDEANGITQVIDEGFDSCLAYHENRGLRIGNPLTQGSPFHKHCQDSHIKIPVFTHPNVSWAYGPTRRLLPKVFRAIMQKDLRGRWVVKERERWPSWCQKVDPVPGAISVEVIEDWRRKKGVGSAFWISRCEAEFPGDTEESVVPRSWFREARARYDEDPSYWDALAEKEEWKHGLDVGDGNDPHAFSSWRGPVLYHAGVWPSLGDRKDTTRAAGRMIREVLTVRGGIAYVDRVGVGAGTLAVLKEEAPKYRTGDRPVWKTHGIHWGAAAPKSRKRQKSIPAPTSEFNSLKAWMMWELREAFREGTVAIAPLPPDVEDMLEEDLAGIHWDTDRRGIIFIEEKKKTIERLGRSSNLGDAVVTGRGVPENLLKLTWGK